MTPCFGNIVENTVSLLDISSSPWLRVLEFVQTKCNDFGLAMLDAVGFEGVEDGFAKLTVPDQFRATWLDSHYGDLIRKAFKTVLGSEFKDYVVRLLAPSKAVPEMKLTPPSFTRPVVKAVSRPKENVDVKHKLYANYTFENFVEGECNSTALRACRTVAENPGDNSLNPLFVYGASGLGKTHLLQAIASEMFAKKSHLRTTYCNATEFLRDYTAIYKGKGDARELQQVFNQRYVECDCLLLDDVQLIEQGPKTLEKLFTLVGHLRSHGKQVVLSCDRHPSSFRSSELDSNRKTAIPRISGTLLAQIESCVAVGLDEPDLNTRLSLIERKSREIPFVAKDRVEICKLLSIAPLQNVRLIEGMLKGLSALHNLNGKELSLNFVRQVTLESRNKNAKVSRTLKGIAEIVAFQYNVDFMALASKRQDVGVSVPRKVAMFLCREFTMDSLQKVGELFNRDYATVIAAIKSLNVQMEKDVNLRQRVEDIRFMLEA